MKDEFIPERVGGIDEGKSGDDAPFTMSNDQNIRRKGVDDESVRTFPQKLMDVLSDTSHSEIISWCDHGNGFMIHRKKAFASEILTKHFKASLFTSFTRKLNRWGFSRVSHGPETGAYYHKLFCRDKPELCTRMTSNSGGKFHSVPLQQQPFPNMLGAIGSFGYPGMAMPGPYIPIMANGESMAPHQKQVMWQHQMQLMQMQQMQMQMIQMPQGMLQGTQMVPGAPSQNENRTTQNSIDDLDPLFGGAHHDIKDSLSDNDEGDDDPVLSSIKSEMV